MAKRTRDDTYGRHRQLVEAADVSTLRSKLGMTQARFAAELGVSVRTVIRGEARGMEIPFHSGSARSDVAMCWQALSNRARKL